MLLTTPTADRAAVLSSHSVETMFPKLADGRIMGDAWKTDRFPGHHLGGSDSIEMGWVQEFVLLMRTSSTFFHQEVQANTSL